MKKCLISLLAACASSMVLAKLPALNDEAKAKAAEAAAKTAWTGKMDGYQLCKSQDKVAVSYYKSAKTSGKDTKPATATPPCADPGAFVYVPAAAVTAAVAPVPATAAIPAVPAPATAAPKKI